MFTGKKLFSKMSLLLVVALLLAACAPAATPAPAPAAPVAPAAPAATTAPAASGKVKIGLSFSDFATERWKNEDALLHKLLEAKGYEVITSEANHDVKLQNDQIDNMVSQGVKGLIVIAEDGDAAVTSVDKAAAAGVKVLAYDRLIKTAKISAYLSFNNIAVGNGQADGVLKALKIDGGKWTKDNPAKVVLLGGSPTDNNAILFRKGQTDTLQKYIDSGVIKIVADQWVDNWDAANAEKAMENIITAQKNQIDAVVASNDGTALGALQALKAQKLAVPISGQDATADGCNSIMKGELTVTIFKDIRKLSPLAADAMDALLQGKPVDGLKNYTMAELTNKKDAVGDVPCVFLPVVEVTKDNLDKEIVQSGFQTKEDVYRDITAPAAGAATVAPAAAGKNPADITIAYTGFATSNAYWNGLGKAAAAEAQAKGVKFIDLTTEAQDASAQKAAVDTVITQKPSAIIIGSVDNRVWKETLANAKAAGIPVFAVDTAIDDPYISALAQTDNLASAGVEGDYICKATGGKGTILVLGGTVGAQSGDDRKKGVTDKVTACGMKVIGDYGNWDNAKDVSISQSTITANPNLVAIFVPHDEGAAAVAAMVKQKGLTSKIQVFGFDALPVMLKAIKAGDSVATLKQDNAGMAKMIVDDAIAVINGQTVDKVTLIKGFIIDKTNVDKYLVP
jgi:D-xylose transport system substrate-binding protein